MFLTTNQLTELTGYQRAKPQAKWLAENRIRYFINGLGRVIVPEESLKPTINQESLVSPDFSQFDAKTS